MAATLLIPTDFSDNSLNAAVYGLALLGDRVDTVKILNAYEEPMGSASSMSRIKDDMVKQSRNDLKAFEIKLSEAASLSGKRVMRFCEEGDLAYVIDNFEEVEKIDLIIMGTQGASGVDEVFMGTNTSDVIAKVEMPLLAVPAECTFKEPRKILIADDGDGCEDGTLRTARSIARKYNASIHIVHVSDQDPSRIHEHSFNPDSFEDIDTHFHVLEGSDVDDVINDFVEANEIDMVVMIHRYMSFFERLFNRSSTKRMSMHSNVPLLILQDS